eukprot:7745238-Pyramimonas_sp.AAC.1
MEDLSIGHVSACDETFATLQIRNLPFWPIQSEGRTPSNSGRHGRGRYGRFSGSFIPLPWKR